MKDDRLSVPVQDDYILALGRATYVFATLEWNAIWCCERLKPGYINKLGRKTAGDIACDFMKRVLRIGDAKLKQAHTGPACEFKRLVAVRNGILHGKPGTAVDGEQRLFRDGVPWTPTMLENAADEFAACSMLLRALLP